MNGKHKGKIMTNDLTISKEGIFSITDRFENKFLIETPLTKIRLFVDHLYVGLLDISSGEGFFFNGLQMKYEIKGTLLILNLEKRMYQNAKKEMKRSGY